MSYEGSYGSVAFILQDHVQQVMCYTSTSLYTITHRFLTGFEAL